MWYIFAMKLFGHKKEWSIDTGYSIDEPWNIMLSERIQSHTQKTHIHLYKMSWIGKLYTQIKSELVVA